MRGHQATVIGAGPGGLAAAILLAGAGMKVTVLERLPRVGGRTSAMEAGGFRFDAGPTFFLYPAILREAVTEAMARVARRLGVEIRLNEPVKEILFAGRRAVGVRTQTGEIRSDALVVNADFARAMSRLVPDHLRSRWTDRKLARKKFSCSTFMLYLGLDGHQDVPHHSIYIAENYEQNLDEIENRHVLSGDPSFYVQNAGVTDPTLAPRGRSTLYVLVPVTHQHPNVDWRKERGRYHDLVLSKLPRVGIEGVEGRIRCERIVTPDDWDRGFEIHRGATFNLAHNLGQMLHLRPRNRFEDLEGVYLVGGGTHPGSGLPVIFESARISSRLLLQDLGIPALREAPLPVEVEDELLARVS